MGKANRGGQRRKEAPARKQGLGGSGLLHKSNHRQQHQQQAGAHRAAGLDGGGTMGKRTLAQQLLQPNKRARGGKRRRKQHDGPASKPRSSETAVIQAEYAAVDAREKAKQDADEARRLRAPVRIKLAPSTTDLRMPSEGGVFMASLRASSSARMVEALLDSITDDPAPDAPASRRPVRSAGRKRKGNPYAVLGDDDTDSDAGSAEDEDAPGCSNGRRTVKPGLSDEGSRPATAMGSSNVFGGAWTGKGAHRGPMAFASSASFAGFGSGGGGGGAGTPWRGARASGVGAGASAGAAVAVNGVGAAPTQATAVAASANGDDGDDPDL